MKVKARPRIELRKRERQFARRNIRLLGFIVLILAIPGVMLWFAPESSLRMFALGGLAVGIVWTISSTIVFGSGSINDRFGAWGEEATRDELKKLSRDGWEFVQGIVLGQGDIDGIAVGPGGVLAVEVKWINSGPRKTSHVPYIRSRYADQARANARSTRLLLSRSFGVDVTVRPLVVIWGQGASAVLPSPLTHGDVPMILGHDLIDWLRNLPPLLDAKNRRLVCSKLSERLEQQTV